MTFVETKFISNQEGPIGLQGATDAEVQISDLYAQYEQQISAYALRRTSPANAGDVVAETFMTAWRRREDIPAEPKTLPWLYGVSRRVLANRRRSDERHNRLRERLTREPSAQDTPVTLIESTDAFGEVTNAIRALPDADAEILRLTAWEGLGPSEIAAMLGIEPTAARQRLFRARQRLTEQIERQAADRERRAAMKKIAAIIFALFLTGAGIAAAGLFAGGSTLETDIDQMENDEFTDPDGEDEGARAVVETDPDSELPPAPIAGAIETEGELDAEVEPEPAVAQAAAPEVDDVALGAAEASEADVRQDEPANAAAAIQRVTPAASTPASAQVAELTGSTQVEGPVQEVAGTEGPGEGVAVIGAAPVKEATTTQAPATTSTTVPGTTTTTEAAATTTTVAKQVSTTAAVAKQVVTTTTDAATTQAPATTTEAPTTTSTTEAPTTTRTPTTTTTEAPTTTTTEAPAVESVFVATGPFNPSEDLFVFQLDFVARDDAHSTVANAEAVTAFGIDPVIVAGTAALDSNNGTRDYEDVMNATWGNDWFDAQDDRSLSIDAVADKWLSTLDDGGDVWVAEGGVSDFTADVLREVQDVRPDLDTSDRVHVVHHNARNIDETVDADMAFIQSDANFIRISDGNGDNGTADLNMGVDGFEAAALEGEFSAGWDAAFDLMPAEDLDFSDTVTSLYLLGVDKDELATVEDFQDAFIG